MIEAKTEHESSAESVPGRSSGGSAANSTIASMLTRVVEAISLLPPGTKLPPSRTKARMQI